VLSFANRLRLCFAKWLFRAKFLFYVFLCVSPIYAQETSVPQEIPVTKDVVAPEDAAPKAPIDITPPVDLATPKMDLAAPKNAANVPLPPEKPVSIDVQSDAIKNQKPRQEESSKEEAAPAATEQPAETIDAKPAEAVIDVSIPLPPSKPQFDLPLPPSMMPPKADEKDEEGEEEGASGGVEKQVDSVELACIEPEVMNIVKKAGAFFRAVPIITSGYRARGRRGSLHRMCKAVDFIVPGVSTHTLANYLKALPEAGGVGTYCHTKSVHIDVGEPRNWGYCGFRRTYFSLR
jgi:Peptidase M15